MSPAPETPEGAATPEHTERSKTPEAPETAIASRPLPPGPEGFQLLGDETAGYCADGVCALPGAGEPNPAEGWPTD